MDTLMWEAKAAEGRGAELLRWVLDEVRRLADPQVRTEVFIAGERVVVIAVGEAAPRRLPDPPEALVERPPHAWPFTRVHLPT
ncbi:hypothetical protein K3N28_06695 [Glycomyces sp. TRM65418]|uniref:hypothetical protein n=1 Tax=Glycomyces sp. TRM65418 TaxID=2867006 RepID=UPI001CE6B2DE|nr:hypothetical protein [Glycomyces sp. TRM65418]MCC3762758.1 hypothetical protein [Glycomyces sp. TRM65418]QZD56789.1 hypothetical protein K3N28_06645 [Glycomyces sp. TRM65418]